VSERWAGRFTVAVGHPFVVAALQRFPAIGLIRAVIEVRAVNHLNIYGDLVMGKAELACEPDNIVDVRSYAEAVVDVGQLTERKISVMVAAETGSCRACTVVVVWPSEPLAETPNWKVLSPPAWPGFTSLLARLSAPALKCSWRGLDIVAAACMSQNRLFPTHRRCFVGNDSFHANTGGIGTLEAAREAAWNRY